MINKHLVKMHFNANARSYDLYAHVQKKMASRLIEFSNIKQVEPVNEILDIGCGTGHLTELLRKHFPTARITAVDIAPQMIEFAADKFHGRDIEFICADAQEMELSRNYDLIVSNASFQWFNNLQLTLEQLYSKLNNNGILCFSTFGDKTFNELHKSYNIAKQNLEIDMDAPPGQSFYKLDELYDLCGTLNHPIGEIKSEELLEYMYFDTVMEFFASVKKVGAANSNKGYIHRSPSLIRELIRVYETNFRENGKIKVTYHCLYGAIKKSSRV